MDFDIVAIFKLSFQMCFGFSLMETLVPTRSYLLNLLNS